MLKSFRLRKVGESGQITSEYVIMLTMCTIIAATLMTLFYYFSEYGWRMIKLVSINYP